VVAGVSCVANLVLLAPLHVAGEQPPSDGTQLRLVSFNIRASNTAMSEVVHHLSKSQSNLIVLFEVTPEWLHELKQLEPAYRIELAEPRLDNFGIALLSRGLKVSARILRPPGGDIGFVEARMSVDGRDWSILGIHPLPPVGAGLADQRDAALEYAASWAAQQTGPVVVLGDFNTTPFSFSFNRLLGRGRLVNSQKGYGVQATWPQVPLWLAPARIPIDHLVHSRSVVTLDRSVGPALGSDHRPVIATVAAAR
jgi:endonuclease/exonuclease/phosphatase (EEP) superfamily protein YafD